MKYLIVFIFLFIGCSSGGNNDSGSKEIVKKDWYTKDKTIDSVLAIIISVCADNKHNNQTIISTVKYVYGEEKISDKKDLKIAKCTKHIMSKYSAIEIWEKGTQKKDEKFINDFSDYIKKVRNDF